MVKIVSAASLFAAGVALVLGAAPRAASNPPTVVVPLNGAQYRDPAGLSAADAKRQLELQEEQAADIREMRDLLRALAEKHGAAVPQAVKKGPELLAVVRQHCAACHRPGKRDGDLELVTDDEGTALNRLRDRDWAEVLNRVEKGSMPPPGGKRRKLTADEKAAFKR